MTKKKNDIMKNLISKEVRKTNYLDKIKVYCKNCGHPEIIKHSRDYVICSYCNHIIFKNDKCEFKYNMKNAMK